MDDRHLLVRKIPQDFAYRLWYQNYAHKSIDEEIAVLFNSKVRAGEGGKLRMTRKALLLSSNEMAKRNGILRGTYLKLEKSDAAGSIKLKTLSALAESIECELIYFLRPKSGQRFSQILWNRLEAEVLTNGMYIAPSGERRHRTLYGGAKRVLANPGFARAQGWSQQRLNMFYDRS